MAHSISQYTSELRKRQDALVRVNTALLRQAEAMVTGLTDAQFSAPPEGMKPHRAGAQLRHVLEFYECFLDGVASLHIDYDARRRDESVERSRPAALSRIRQIVQRLETEPELRGDSSLFVRAEDATQLGLNDPYTTSSISRELIVLSSHTIHHFALIAAILRAHGVTVDDCFGVAPSTLTHRASLRRPVAAIEAA